MEDKKTKVCANVEKAAASAGDKPIHKRRAHYSGKYPRKFEEKYKERNPEEYKDTVEKVISKGSTPAGMHIPIMVAEILEHLDIKEGQKGLDCTLGYGGHTTEILKKLNHTGHLYSLDVDSIEIVKTKQRIADRGFTDDDFTAIHTNFRNIDQVAAQYGKFDFLMADLGVSSMQLDNPERGFSYKFDGPLDLRLDPESGISAAERLKELSQDEIENMLIENSDEIYAGEIAKAIADAKRKRESIETTMELKALVEKALVRLPKDVREDETKKALARTFQALRIDVNSELDVLYEFLEKLPDVLNPGARVCVLTFHSGEDRLVKKAFKSGLKDGLFEEVSEDVIRPGRDECYINPRARSTKLRWAIKA